METRNNQKKKLVKKKKKNQTANQEMKGEKKVKSGQKLRLGTVYESPMYV